MSQNQDRKVLSAKHGRVGIRYNGALAFKCRNSASRGTLRWIQDGLVQIVLIHQVGAVLGVPGEPNGKHSVYQARGILCDTHQ